MFKSLYEKSPLSIEHKSAPHYPLELTIGGKKLTFANPKAIRSYLLIMDQFAVNGGSACHWGGPSGITELATALYTYFFEQKNWTQNFNFVNDIGHAENAFYSLKSLWEVGGLKTADLQGFRSISSKLTGHGESHLYPEGVLLSNGPLSSALPQAQGLAIADKLMGNNRTTIALLSDGASMEGEAKEAFAAIPGLASKNKINPFIMIISDNNTKLTGRIDEDSFSQKNNFLALEKIGWKLIHVEDGHSIEACYKNLTEAVEQAKSSPVCIILKTVKGKGIKETEDAKSGGHGFPLKSYDEKLLTFLTEIWGSEKVPAEITTFAQKALVKPVAKDSSAPVPKVKIQDGVSKALNEMREKGFPVVSLSSDLQGSTGVAGFHKKHPESAIDLGIAESNMVSAAAGLSKAGLIPVVDTFAAFGITKGNLPLVMASLSSAPMIAIFSHTGFQDAADGASHQSLTYFSALCAIPNVKTIVLSTSEEAYVLIKEAVEKIAKNKMAGKHEESYVFFLGRETFVSDHGKKITWDEPALLKEGNDLLIVSNGPTIHEALQAAEALAAKGIHASVINHCFANSENIQLIAQTLDKCHGKLITVEDHQINGGMGAFLVHKLISGKTEIKKYVGLGVKGVFGQSAYTAKELYAKHGIDSEAITKIVQSM